MVKYNLAHKYAFEASEMNKRIKVGLGAAGILLSLTVALLANFNLKKEYKYGDYVPEEDAYFVEKIEDKAGLIKAKKFITPTDSKYSTQKSRSLGKNLIGDIESVWSSYTGKGTKIAILDDGFDYTHPEYKRLDGTSAILSTSRYYYASGNSAYYKEYSNDPTCIAEDWETSENAWATHGTNTSTTAAAPINDVGGVGIAPEADILALKIDFSFVAIKAAIQYAINQHVDVINMSLGAYAESFVDGWGDNQSGSSSTATYLNSVCQSAYNAGIIVVAAAGNESTWHKSYPACNTKVIGVGALGDWDNKGNANELAEFSNYVDPSQTGEINVDILAPGYVYTASLKGKKSSPSRTYADTQGTSFSCPIIAGAACLWKEKYPSGTPDQFLNQLQSTADGIGFYTDKMIKVSGWDESLSDVGPSNITQGRLNVANLMDINDPYVDTVQSTINICINEKKQINIASSSGSLSYSSANTNIATVSSGGLVEGKGAGTTTVTVTASKNGKTASANVTVNVAASIASTSIQFNPKTKTLSVGDTYNAEASITVEPNNASRIFMFESSNTSVATVDEFTGLVTAVGAGTATIEVISGYGEGYDTLTITVQDTAKHTGTITFGNGDGDVIINSTSVNGNDSLSNSWNISTSGTSSFTQNEQYSQIGSSKNAASSITFTMTKSSTVDFTNVSASFGGFKDSKANITIKVGSTTIGTGSVSSSSDTTVTNTTTASGTTLTISLSNISKGIKAYSITYSYTVSGGGTTPTVSGVQIIPSQLSLDVYSDPTGNLSATVTGDNSPAQTVTWSSLNENVAKVSNSGSVTAVGAGTTTIKATSTADTTKYGTCTVTVTDSTPKTLTSITISNYKTAFTVGDAFSFGGTVTAHYDDSSSSDVTAGATFSGYSMSTTGSQKVTVSYTHSGVTKTTEYYITISSPSGGETLEFEKDYNRSNLESDWTLTNKSLPSDYILCPDGDDTSVAYFAGIFDGKDINSNVVITLNCATYGSGNNPTSSTFKIFNSEDCLEQDQVTASQSGSLPSSSSYTNPKYTITQSNASAKFVDDLAIKITKPGKQIRIKGINIAFSYKNSTSKVIERLDVTYSGSSIFVGGELDESKVSVTAVFTDSNKYANKVLTSSDYTITGFSSLSAGEKEVTVTYVGTILTVTDPLTSSFNVSVIEDEITKVTITVGKTYHPGESISESDISVSVQYLSGKVENPEFDFEDDGYQFIYEDAASGGSKTKKQFEVTVGDQAYDFDVEVTRVAYVTPSPDTLRLTGTQGRSAGITGTSDSAAANYNSLNINGVMCAATNIYVYTYNTVDHFSFGKSAGEIHNIEPLNKPITSLSIDRRTGARNDDTLSVSTNGSKWVTISEADFNNTNYYYFKVEYKTSNSSYSNFYNINIGLKGTETPTNVANYIMFEDTENQCTTKLDIAIEYLNNMSTADKQTFMTSNDYVISTARERLNAWATSQGKVISLNNGNYTVITANVINDSTIVDNKVLFIVSITVVVELLAFTSFIYFKRKKR